MTPTCVWRTTPALILALDRQFGEPFDTYVNGSQVWLRPDGPGGITIEWRLHPVAGYQRPSGVGTHEVFENVVYALSAADTAPVALDRLWDGLEAFPAYGDEVEPSPLVAATTSALGLAPDAAGLVDHQPIGDAWERNRGGFSVIDELLRQLQP
jgi:hypothetical protein